MSSDFIVRPEQYGDVAGITRVNELAFRSQPHSDQTEHFIVLALRNAGALSLSLVAEQADQVIGHVAFSPVRFSDGSADWFGLGPVAVLPEFRRRGVGKALIDAGLALLRSSGASGCVVLGDPAYYRRFGFERRPEYILEGVPAEYFQALAFKSHAAAGKVAYHEAFSAKGRPKAHTRADAKKVATKRPSKR